jgi:hypothetical protein
MQKKTEKKLIKNKSILNLKSQRMQSNAARID